MSKKVNFCKILLSVSAVFLVLSAGGKDSTAVDINLYGHQVQFHFDAAPIEVRQPITQAELSKVVNQLRHSDLEMLDQQLKAVEAKFQMDDIAAFLLLNKVTANYYCNQNAANVFKYVFLRKRGISTILGFDSAVVTLYAEIALPVVNSLFVKVGDKTFYDLSFSQKALPETQQLFADHLAVAKPMQVNDSLPPLFNALYTPYAYHFEYDGYDYFLNGRLNLSMVMYYRELPLFDFSKLYMSYHLSKVAENGLISELKKITKGMPEKKAIALILKFTQDALQYMDDKQALGEEKFSFPEEVLANKFADCEDKSILFAYLLKEVLNRESVALVYLKEHHVNVAVGVHDAATYSFDYKGKKYIVCEPAGSGFNLGENVFDYHNAAIVSW